MFILVCFLLYSCTVYKFKFIETAHSIKSRYCNQNHNICDIALSPGQTRKHCCGNICDSRCFLKVSLFATRGNIVAETKFASREAKMFPIKFRNISCFPSVIFVAETLFPIVCPP